jgi:prophage regulatory protein
MNGGILRLPAVKARTGLSRSSIYAFASRGDFPRPISLGARAVGWDSGAVDKWIAGRIEQAEQSREARKAEPVSPIVHESADTSDASSAEPRSIPRFGAPGLHMKMGLNAARSQR